MIGELFLRMVQKIQTGTNFKLFLFLETVDRNFLVTNNTFLNKDELVLFKLIPKVSV